MAFWKRALDLLIDPNIIALMLSLGLVGILVELWNPGLILPGHGRARSRSLVGLYGLQVLPVSAAGVAADAASRSGFFVAEAFVVSHGALALAGAVTFVIGSLMLFDPAGAGVPGVALDGDRRSPATLALLLGLALTRVVKARRNPVEVGVRTLVGERGSRASRRLRSRSSGELWRARAADGGALVPGEHVTVEAVEDDLGLVVGSPHPTERV